MSAKKVAEQGEHLVLDENILKLVSGQFDVSLISYVTLCHFNLRSLSNGFSDCISLVELDLSYNSLTSLNGLLPLAAQLERFNVSHNQLSKLTELATFTKLTTLYAQENKVADISSLADIPNTTLQILYLQNRDLNSNCSNTVCSCDRNKYLAAIVSRFSKTLRCLDGHYFNYEEANPKFILAEHEKMSVIDLPKSMGWVTDAYFRSVLFDADKVGVMTEKSFQRLVIDCRKTLEAEKKNFNAVSVK